MSFKLFYIALISSVFTFSAIAEEAKVVGQWSGALSSGNRPCEAKLYSTTGDIESIEMGQTVDLEISMTLLLHGKVEVKTYRFTQAKKNFFKPSELNGGVSQTAFVGEVNGVKLTSAFFEGVLTNELRDLVGTSVSIPHGSHSHTFTCRF